MKTAGSGGGLLTDGGNGNGGATGGKALAHGAAGGVGARKGGFGGGGAGDFTFTCVFRAKPARDSDVKAATLPG
jgi:hypothetical protein